MGIILVTGLILTTPIQVTAKWWEDKFGQPQYGGKIVIVTNRLGETFDPYTVVGCHFYPFEQLFMGDMTLEPDEWSFKSQGIYPKTVGLLAKSYEWSDPQTLIINLRQDVHWQDKKPVNGREFTADDVVYHYDRVLGTGNGFTEPNPITRRYIDPIIGVNARDKHTIVMKFKGPETLLNWWAATDSSPANMIEPREFVESNPKDWRNSAGTGSQGRI